MIACLRLSADWQLGLEVTGEGKDMLGHIDVLPEDSWESPWEIPVFFLNQDRSQFQQISWDPKNALHG